MQDIDALKALHTALVDARKAYETAVTKADAGSPAAILHEAEGLHAGAHSAVHDSLTSRGEQPDGSGSFMSTLNKAVVLVRSAVIGPDEQSLKAFARGDETILQRFDNAIGAYAGEPATVEMLLKHRAALVEMIARMRAAAE